MNSWLSQIGGLASQYASMQAQAGAGAYAASPTDINAAMGQMLNNGGIGGAGGEMMDEWNNVFMPEVNSLVQDANSYAGTARTQFNMGQSESQVGQAFDQNRQSALADLQSFGIDPSSGRYAALDQAERTAQAASQAGAGNIAEQQTEAVARALRSEAIQATANLPGYAAGLQNAATNLQNSNNNMQLGEGQLNLEEQKLQDQMAMQRFQLTHQPFTYNGQKPSNGNSGSGNGRGNGNGGGGGGNLGSGSGGGGGAGGGYSGMGNSNGVPIAEGAGGSGGGGAFKQPGSAIMGSPGGGAGGTGTSDDNSFSPEDLPNWDGTSGNNGALSPLDPSFDPSGNQDPFTSGAAGPPDAPFSGDNSDEFGSDMPTTPSVQGDPYANATNYGWANADLSDVPPTGTGSPDGGDLNAEIGNADTSIQATRSLGSPSTSDASTNDTGGENGGTDFGLGGGDSDNGDTSYYSGSTNDGSSGGDLGGDLGGSDTSDDSGSDDGSYAAGGDVQAAHQAVHQRVGAIPASMSPSRGRRTDDVAARLNQTGEQIRLNQGEFIVPEDAVRWKGEEYFQKLIDQSRKARQKATAKPSMKPAIPMGAR